jgi:hypothetical protein
MDRFKLSEKLRMFLMIENGFRHPYLGTKLAVSIRANFGYTQSLWIFPQAGYNCITVYEFERLLWIAKSLDLDISIISRNGVPVIEIEDYSVNPV